MKTPAKRRAKQKLYQRQYRKTHKAKVSEYNKRTVKERASRNKARRMMKKKYGAKAIKGRDVHHKSGNPLNNSSKNLKIVRKHHSGGPKSKR